MYPVNRSKYCIKVPRPCGVRVSLVRELRSKSLTAQIDEALCKVLCHNLCVLIQSVHELGIQTTFEAEIAFASKPMSI